MILRTLAPTLTLLLAAAWAQPVQAARVLDIPTGTSRVLHFRLVRQVAVGNKDIAGVLPLRGRREVLVNGNQPGRTTLFVWTTDGVEHDYDIHVTADSLDMLAAMLRGTIARSDVTVRSFGHAVVVRGTVPDGSALQGITDVISRFEPIAKQDQAVIVNAAMIAHPLGDLRTGASALDPAMRDVRVDPDGQGNVIVSGRVLDEAQRQEVLNDVRGMSGRYLSSKGQVIDRLAETLTTQIDVKVYVLSIDDTGLNQLGVNLQTYNPASSTPGSALTFGTASIPLIESIPNPLKPFEIGPFARTTSLVPTIDLMMSEGHATILSAPDLTTTPGQPATFLVGGQIPIPESGGLGSVTVTYKDYGVQLNVTPTILPSGDIATLVAPQISDLDFSNGITENGFVIPAFTTSQLSTNVITSPGQSIILGGMLRHLDQRTISKIPFLSQIPILGKLFQDVRYQTQDEHVVFIMTPTVITR